MNEGSGSITCGKGILAYFKIYDYDTKVFIR